VSLFFERLGSGPDVLLIHGWGMHGGIWGELPQRLAQNFTVTVVDLPGHGRSHEPPSSATLDAFTNAVVAIAPPTAIWIGWSLGGIVAMNAALRHSRRVARLVLVASTPKFVASADWPHAMSAAHFAEFTASIVHDYRATLQRFLSLQFNGDETGRPLLRRLRSELFVHGDPAAESLCAGLEILKRSDLRGTLGEIRVPTLVLHGSHDRLAMPAAAEYLASQIADARCILLPGAGHAPFLSQPQQFEASLRGFLP